MKLALIILLLFSQAAFSRQTAPQSTQSADPSAYVTKVVRVRYALPQRIADLISGGGSPVVIRADNVLNVIVLKGASNIVSSFEQTVRELDVPAAAQASKNKDIELVVSVIGGSNRTELLQGGQLPVALDPVIRQLRAVFPYKNYQLLSSLLLRSSANTHAENKGLMKSLTDIPNYSSPSDYSVGYGEATISSEEGNPVVHLRNFRFDTVISTGDATNIQHTHVLIITDIDLREGQKVVAGKVNIDNSDSALFVVLTARLVD